MMSLVLTRIYLAVALLTLAVALQLIWYICNWYDTFVLKTVMYFSPCLFPVVLWCWLLHMYPFCCHCWTYTANNTRMICTLSNSWPSKRPAPIDHSIGHIPRNKQNKYRPFQNICVCYILSIFQHVHQQVSNIMTINNSNKHCTICPDLQQLVQVVPKDVAQTVVDRFLSHATTTTWTF